MSQMQGEIKLLPFDDVPEGWLRCEGQLLNINKYPKLYMLIGTKFGNDGDFQFKLPLLKDLEPRGMSYCIAIGGKLPKIRSKKNSFSANY